MVASAAPLTARAAVEVNVTRIGFPTLRRGDVVRTGAWVPVIVDVALVDERSFDGAVRVGQLDIDGDECFDRVDVHLRAETGGNQRLYLYIPANPVRSRGIVTVEVFDNEGESVQIVSQGELVYQARSAQPCQVIDDDDILVLSLSTGAIGRVQDLAGPDQGELYARPLHIGHMSPGDLPELWIGLEAVDYIVWDDARPDQLTERQLLALLGWVRQGGTLLIAASRTAGSLVLTDTINKVLPVDIGELSVVDNLPEVRRALLGSEADENTRVSAEEEPWWETPFNPPIPVVACTLREGAVRIPDRGDYGSDLVTRRRVGRGQVIFCGVTLKDLFSAPGRAADFFQIAFRVQLLGREEPVRAGPKSLFPHVVSSVAFLGRGSLYLGAAFTFCAIYLLLATFGTWWFLEKRGWTHLSWSLFAVVALAASFISVVAVNSAHGFGETLRQISIVDMEADKGYGYATAFFGLKTGSDKELDLWLPSESLGANEPGATSCFLRPLPPSNDPTEASSSFADPEPYRLEPGSAVIDDVRIRATLKRFEGRWEGPMRGAVTADITVKGPEIQEGSYIASNLGVELNDCFLIHTDLALTRRAGARDEKIYVFPIGTISSDGRRIDLAARCYRFTANEKLSGFLQRSTLRKQQGRWGKELSGLLSAAQGQEKNALLLASTVGEFTPDPDAIMRSLYMGSTRWGRDRLRTLDMRDQLQPGSVILIGFADHPGPARLFSRTRDRPFRMLDPDPDESWTMYRIRIPVTLRHAEPVDELEEEIDRRLP